MSTKWTDDVLIRLAARYSDRLAFRTAHPSAYCTAHKRGILPTICAHMPTRRRSVYAALDAELLAIRESSS